MCVGDEWGSHLEYMQVIIIQRLPQFHNLDLQIRQSSQRMVYDLE